VSHGLADPLRAVGAATPPPGPRPCAQAALDAAATAALCAGSQDHAAPSSGTGAPPRGVWHHGGRQAHPGPRGWHINTAFVERINLTIRQHVAAVGRRVSTLCKGEDGLQQQLAVFHCYYNFCLPHTSLRLPLPQPEPTKGSGSATQWQPCT